MSSFAKYFLGFLILQFLLIGFVIFTGKVLGHAVGDGLMFILYVSPWIIIFPQGFGQQTELSWVSLIFGVLIPAMVYAAIFSMTLIAIKKIISRRNIE